MAVGGWKYRAGLALIGVVVLIWVASAEVTQLIFTRYRHPFVLTWLGASLLGIYLPIALLKDFIQSFATSNVPKVSKRPHIDSASPRLPISISPRAVSKQDVELQRLTNGSTEFDIVDEGKSLLSPEIGGKEKVPNSVHQLSLKELFKMALVLAPLWVITEYLSNASLSLTSVASTTILSSTSGLFTLLFGVSVGHDSLTTAKVLAVLVSIAGVIMTELGKTSAADEKSLSGGDKLPGETAGDHGLPGHTIVGDLFGLASAASYGFYTIMLKKYAGEEEGKEPKADMQKLFGCIGIVTLVGLWWLGIPLILIGWEPYFEFPRSVGLDEDILANSLVGSVISDYFWALTVVWTTPLVATLGLSLTIPLAMLADMVMHGRVYSFVYIVGSIQVFGGFLIANLADRCSLRNKPTSEL